MLSRRSALTGAAALLADGRSARADAGGLFASGPLARNPLARSFRAMRLPAPSLTLLSRDGPRNWADLRGKVHLVTLWAEWCAPCLIEARDFALLEQRYGGNDFGVVAMLTASMKKLDVEGAAAALARVRAADLPTWVEPAGGMTLFRSLATTAGGASSLPCTLVVDVNGRIRGRAIGAMVLGIDGRDGVLSDTDKARLRSRGARTAWGSREADTFVQGLIGGALA